MMTEFVGTLKTDGDSGGVEVEVLSDDGFTVFSTIIAVSSNWDSILA
jgi:hypothetical protein